MADVLNEKNFLPSSDILGDLPWPLGNHNCWHLGLHQLAQFFLQHLPGHMSHGLKAGRQRRQLTCWRYAVDTWCICCPLPHRCTHFHSLSFMWIYLLFYPDSVIIHLKLWLCLFVCAYVRMRDFAPQKSVDLGGSGWIWVGWTGVIFGRMRLGNQPEFCRMTWYDVHGVHDEYIG